MGHQRAQDQRRAPGNLGHLGPFSEFDWSIAVESDVWPGVPTPRIALAASRIFSESPGFLDHAHRVDRFEVDHVPSLRIDFGEDGLSTSVYDDRGPIWTMTSAHEGPPVWAHRTYWGQETSRLASGTWSQAWSWSGEAFHHQQAFGKPAAILHPHPVWGSLDVRGAGERTFEQVFTRPGVPLEMVFYRPTLVVPPPGERAAPSAETGVGGG